jgi:hypothetical protein
MGGGGSGCTCLIRTAAGLEGTLEDPDLGGWYSSGTGKAGAASGARAAERATGNVTSCGPASHPYVLFPCLAMWTDFSDYVHAPDSVMWQDIRSSLHVRLSHL